MQLTKGNSCMLERCVTGLFFFLPMHKSLGMRLQETPFICDRITHFTVSTFGSSKPIHTYVCSFRVRVMNAVIITRLMNAHTYL